MEVGRKWSILNGLCRTGRSPFEFVFSTTFESGKARVRGGSGWFWGKRV